MSAAVATKRRTAAKQPAPIAARRPEVDPLPVDLVRAVLNGLWEVNNAIYNLDESADAFASERISGAAQENLMRIDTLLSEGAPDQLELIGEFNSVASLMLGALRVGGDITAVRAGLLWEANRIADSVAICLGEPTTWRSQLATIVASLKAPDEIAPIPQHDDNKPAAQGEGLFVSERCADIGAGAAVRIAAIAILLAEQLHEARSGMMETPRFGVLCDLAKRAEQLANVNIAIFSDDVPDADGLAALLEGASA